MNSSVNSSIRDAFVQNKDSPEAEALRRRMVAEQIAARGIRDERILDALRRIPRHRFLPDGPFLLQRAYADGAQGIGAGQTISQPVIVALMTETLALTGNETVLEIGAGSGYQTAVLSSLCRRVVAIERHAILAERARRVLQEVGVTNAEIHLGDGSNGWPAEAPYDAILVAAVAPEVPPALLSQLAPGGRLILPVSVSADERGPQRLILLTRSPNREARDDDSANDGFLNDNHANGEWTRRDLGDVAFVPLIGAAGFGLPADLGEMDV